MGSISRTRRPDDNHNRKRTEVATHLMITTTRAQDNPRANSNFNGKPTTATAHTDDSREGGDSCRNSDDPTSGCSEGGSFGSISHQDTVDQTQRASTETRQENTNIKSITTLEDDTTAHDDDRSRTCSEGSTLPRQQSESGGRVKQRTAHQRHNNRSQQREHTTFDPTERRQPTQHTDTQRHKPRHGRNHDGQGKHALADK